MEKLGLSAPELTQSRAIQDRWKLADGEKLEKLTADTTVCAVLLPSVYYPISATNPCVLPHVYYYPVCTAPLLSHQYHYPITLFLYHWYYPITADMYTTPSPLWT